MEFTVPQFIEYEAKVIGPFTFKQFLIVGGAGIVCFALYLKVDFYIFLFLTIIIEGSALAITFLKFGGRSPLIMVKNFFFYNVSPKIYIWQRKKIMPKIIKQEEIKLEEKEPELRVAKRSKIGDLATKVETKKG